MPGAKDLFFSDLLRELAKGAAPASVPGAEESVGTVVQNAADHLDWLSSADGRKALLLEMLRTSRDYETARNSNVWRTYLALHATFLSLEDGELRDDVQAALHESEGGFIERIAESHRTLAGLLGYRIRPGLDADFDLLARMGSAMLRGLVLMTPSMPEIAERPVGGDPFGVEHITGPVAWPQAGLAYAGFVMSIVEPDPTVQWDDDRIAYVTGQLAGGVPPA